MRAIEVRTVEPEFFDMLAIGAGTANPRRMYRRLFHVKLIQGAASPDLGIIWVRSTRGRWFPSLRRFILWHEFQHFRLLHRFGHRPVLLKEINFWFLDGIGFFAYPHWLLYRLLRQETLR